MNSDAVIAPGGSRQNIDTHSDLHDGPTRSAASSSLIRPPERYLIDSLRLELRSAREHRDRLQLQLLDAEMALAGLTPEVRLVGASLERRLLEAEVRAAKLSRNIAEMKASLSWRLTAPARRIKRRIRRRIRRRIGGRSRR